MCDLLAFCNEVWEKLGKLSIENRKGNYFNERRCNTAAKTPSRSNRRDGEKPGNRNQHLPSKEPSLLSSHRSVSRSHSVCGAAKLLHDRGFG